jgi:spore photoproduct lyase
VVYEPFVEQVFRTLAPTDVTYMSMGSLRFAPELRDVVRQRFPKSRILSAELFPAADGKMRYFRPLRTAMYRQMLTWIRRHTQATPLYLCMETQTVWQQALDYAPTCSTEVEQYIQHGDEQGRGVENMTMLLATGSLRTG